MPAGEGPAHRRIASWLAEELAHGGLATDGRLPAERDLAALLGVSRMTLRQALADLQREGLVSRRVGRGGGTFVGGAHVATQGLPSLSEQFRGLRARAGTRVLERVERAPVGEELAVLGSGRVYALRRLRVVSSRVISVEQGALVASAFPGLLDGPLAGDLDSLVTREYPVAPTRAVERLEPGVAEGRDATDLGVEPATPVFVVTRTSYSRAGTALQLFRECFRGDRLHVVWESPTGTGREAAAQESATVQP